MGLLNVIVSERDYILFLIRHPLPDTLVVIYSKLETQNHNKIKTAKKKEKEFKINQEGKTKQRKNA